MGDAPDDPTIIINPGTPPNNDDTPGRPSPSPSSPPSGGGSSAPSAPPVDPVIARKMADFQAIYIQLWGEPATEAYLKSLANKGLNRWEFEELERNKPAFRRTETYRDQGSSLAELLAQLGVTAPIQGAPRRRGGKGKGGGGNGQNDNGGEDPNRRRPPRGQPVPPRPNPPEPVR